MSNKILPKFEDIHTIVFDFDGVFTDNKVYVNEKGEESVCCDRSDGLAIELIRKLSKEKNWPLELCILTREENKVVLKRAEKLKINCYGGVKNKLKIIKKIINGKANGRNGLIYLGNDINDIQCMEYAGFAVAPIDAHISVIKIADMVIEEKGGNGFVRKFIEELLYNHDLIKLINN